MSVKPIIFSGPMVYAINDGQKTQTRRILTPPPFIDRMGNFCAPDRKGKLWNWGQNSDGSPCLRNYIAKHVKYAVGDILWVRETVRAVEDSQGVAHVRYAADQHWERIPNTEQAAERWVNLYGYRGKRGAPVPAIHMPRWVSRLTLEVTKVKVERLQDISYADAEAEGAFVAPVHRDLHRANARDRFTAIWDDINGKRVGAAWAVNPWVVAPAFKVHRMNVDVFLAARGDSPVGSWPPRAKAGEVAL